LRDDTQWDIRLDTADIDINMFIQELKTHKDKLLYALVGAKEYGMNPSNGFVPNSAYESEHVHVAIVTYNKMKRNEVMRLFREHKLSGEYCVPRNQKFTYAGWKIHHIKDETKIGEDRILWEYGTLPMDVMTPGVAKSIKAMIHKYPSTEGTFAERMLASTTQYSLLDRLEQARQLVKDLTKECVANTF